MAKIDAIGDVNDVTLAPFFSHRSELPEDWRGYFREHDLLVSYLHDPDGIFGANIRRCTDSTFLSGPSQIENGGMHAAAQLASPFAELGVAVDDFAPRLHFMPERIAAAQAKLGCTPVLALHPGSGSPRKNWPISSWISLIEHLVQRTDRVMAIAGEADSTQIAALRGKFGERLHYAIGWPLYDLGAILRQTIFVGHDSGISHLAAASDARCTILFGPTKSEVWAPPGENISVLRAAGDDLNRLPLTEVCAKVDQELIRIGIST
ncbi:MAG: glycosyltransferase family 9 protein [Verrucomicrobiota bacterium]